VFIGPNPLFDPAPESSTCHSPRLYQAKRPGNRLPKPATERFETLIRNGR
jgi:hypothetical protein